MPAPGRLITLNIGSQTIGLAKFRGQPRGGLVLLDYRFREILADPAGEGTRPEQITAALREMLNELGIKSSSVNYAVGAQSAFLRFVKLPRVEEEKIDRIIGFEAQQNVPFPIDEVVWDYQIVGGGMDEQIQVVIVAIKADHLEGINAAVEESGLRANKIGIATTGLYNAFRYNYADINGCSLLVDIGARTTNLVFIEPGKVFMRSVPIAGSSITAAVAKEFRESFAAAEFRKKRDAFVGLGGPYAEPDPEIARVSKIARSTMTRLHAELMRSITRYRAQEKGSAPERVFLAGGSCGLRYMREFFDEKLRVPVELFNPLRNIATAESAPVREVAQSAHLLGELVGLALRSVTICPIELNLLPESVVRRKDFEKRRPFFIVTAACFLLALLGWSAYFARAAGVTRQSTQRLQQKIDTMRSAEARVDKLKKEATSLDAIATPLITAINDRSFWSQILQELNARLPDSDIWITELAATSGEKLLGTGEKRTGESGTTFQSAGSLPPASKAKASEGGLTVDGIYVRGLYMYNPKQQELVVDYFRNLAQSPFFVVDAKKPERVIKSNAVPSDREWAFPFELQLTLRHPVKFP
jgi:type IV pilus assembly protein PilM